MKKKRSKFDTILKRPDTAMPPGPRVRGKSSDPATFRKMTVYVTRAVHRDVKIALLKQDPQIDMSDLVEQQLTAWLKTQTT